jgi:hypothetical protein
MRTSLVAALFLIGCTSSSPSGGTHVSVTGSIGATPLHIQSVASTVFTEGDKSAALVYLSPFADACSATSITEANQGAIELALVKAGAGGSLEAATDPGVYKTTVGGTGPWVEIDTFARDGACQPTDDEGKGDGTVTLTRAGADGYAGSFDFTAAGSHVTGTFSTVDSRPSIADGPSRPSNASSSHSRRGFP